MKLTEAYRTEACRSLPKLVEAGGRPAAAADRRGFRDNGVDVIESGGPAMGLAPAVPPVVAATAAQQRQLVVEQPGRQ